MIHVKSDGVIGDCHAQSPESCPFSSEGAVHVETMEEALVVSEGMLAQNAQPPVKRKTVAEIPEGAPRVHDLYSYPSGEYSGQVLRSPQETVNVLAERGVRFIEGEDGSVWATLPYEDEPTRENLVLHSNFIGASNTYMDSLSGLTELESRPKDAFMPILVSRANGKVPVALNQLVDYGLEKEEVLYPHNYNVQVSDYISDYDYVNDSENYFGDENFVYEFGPNGRYKNIGDLDGRSVVSDVLLSITQKRDFDARRDVEWTEYGPYINIDHILEEVDKEYEERNRDYEESGW